MSKAPFPKLLVILACLFSLPQSGRAQGAGLLDLPLVESPAWKSIVLSNALGQLGSCVQEGYVLFGLEETLQGGKEPTVSFQVKPGMALGDSLREILAQLPPYDVEIVSDHLIDLRPAGAKQDPNNILNLRIPNFDAVSMKAYSILDAPRDVIPPLNEALTPKPEPGKRVITLYFGGYHGGPMITLHLKNVTVREILNATAVASERSTPAEKPRGWLYALDPEPRAGKPRHSWGSLLSLPRDWNYKVQRDKGSLPR